MRVIAFVVRVEQERVTEVLWFSQQYGADAIIDDGLLISHGKVIAGTSAKKNRQKLRLLNTHFL